MTRGRTRPNRTFIILAVMMGVLLIVGLVALAMLVRNFSPTPAQLTASAVVGTNYIWTNNILEISQTQTATLTFQTQADVTPTLAS